GMAVQWAPKDAHGGSVITINTKVRIGSIAVTVGTAWWASRASGLLMTSMLASTPAWRSLDPLPVLERNSDDEHDASEDDGNLDDCDEGRPEIQESNVAGLFAAASPDSINDIG